MAWIGLRDKNRGWFDQARQSEDVAGRREMIHGSIVVETRISAETRPQTLLAFRRSSGVAGQFSLQALPRGGIVMVDALGDDISHATLPFHDDGRLDILRLTYSWDQLEKIAWLTLERPETDLVQTVQLRNPLPIFKDDLNAALAHGCDCAMDDEVLFVAVSNCVETVGPMPALTSLTPIQTVDGQVSVGQIKRGEMVVTEMGETVPVLQVVKRTVPARGSFRPIRLRAPYFGLSHDIVIAPQQRLVMSGSQVEYMFGREAVLVPARHLVNDRSAFVARGPDMVTYHHLLLPGHEVILAGGACPLESLYMGRLRRKPDALANSVLARFDRVRLPEHAKPVWPVLKPFEAVTLALMRAA